jgi:hypothetical protein
VSEVAYCVDCGIPLSRMGVMRCGPHAMKERYARRKQTAACLDCGKSLYDGRSTRCKVCNGRAMAKLRNGTTRAERVEVVVCDLDGLRVADHPRCQLCTALTGDAHTQQIRGGGLCSSCVQTFQRAERRGVQWSEVA